MPDTLVSTADGSHTLVSARYGETYRSTHGAVSEARQVFLEASGLAERLRAGQASELLEVGFGLATTVLASAELARQCGTPLTLTSVENDLVPIAAIKACRHDAWMAYPELLDRLIKAWPECQRDPGNPMNHPHASDATPASSPSYVRSHGKSQGPSRGTEHLIVLCDQPDIRLRLLLADISDLPLDGLAVDAVYLDGFSHAKNPAPWSVPVLRRLKHAMRPGARLATYSSRGQLRRDLESIGLRVHRLPGPAGKRETLSAELEHTRAAQQM